MSNTFAACFRMSTMFESDAGECIEYIKVNANIYTRLLAWENHWIEKVWMNIGGNAFSLRAN